MPPRRRCRHIESDPDITYFKPQGVTMLELEEVVLPLDEFEAIRLKDLKGLEQKDAAKRMDISQPTFHRLVSVARKKIADAIVNGKSLKIDKHAIKISHKEETK